MHLCRHPPWDGRSRPRQKVVEKSTGRGRDGDGTGYYGEPAIALYFIFYRIILDIYKPIASISFNRLQYKTMRYRRPLL